MNDKYWVKGPGFVVWTVLLETGERVPVQVHRAIGLIPNVADLDGWFAINGDAEAFGYTQAQSVCALMHEDEWQWDEVGAIEILGPGDLTADECVAAERARNAAVCRAIATRIDSPEDGGTPYDGRSDVARECAEAIERGTVTW